MKYPEVRGEKITSKERLRELVNDEYSALKRKKDFPRRMNEAKTHLDLMKNYEGQEWLEYGDISRIAKDLKVDAQTVSNWLTKGMTPRLYTYLEWATPKSEASEKVRGILEANKGVRSPQDVYQRLDNYYLGPEERNSRFAKREEKKMLKYYEFLDRYAGGGNHLDIAKEVGVSDSGARAYLDGATPRWVGLAGQIPSENPRPGYKWLPQKYEHGGHGGRWSDWVEAPKKVTSYKQVLEVLGKLEPLDNEAIRRLSKSYGYETRYEDFMHLLGSYVSDCRVFTSSTSSMGLAISQTKAHDWSRDFGSGVCYDLGQIGISASRIADVKPNASIIKTKQGIREIVGDAQYQWGSESSPLIRWIRRSCLGYDDSAKTYQKIDADWIPNAIRPLRLAFLQGWCDGDGGVSARGYYFGISTHRNHELAEKILNSFDIETYRSKTYVRTANFDSVLKAAQIRPFKYATGRLDALDRTARMIENRRRKHKSNPIPDEHVVFVVQQRNKGLSYGAIGEALFDKYGYTLDARDIRRLVIGDRKAKVGVEKEGRGEG